MKKEIKKTPSYSKDDPSLFTLSLKSLVLPDFKIDEDPNDLSKIRPSSDGLFSEVQGTYNTLGVSILKTWCEFITTEMKKTLIQQGYIQKKWFSNNPEFDDPGVALSPEIWLPIHNLQESVKKLYSGMDPSLADEWLEELASQLDKVIISIMKYAIF